MKKTAKNCLFMGACCATLLSPLAGCYSHVVKASGPTSKEYDIYEPNGPEDNQGILGNLGKKKEKQSR